MSNHNVIAVAFTDRAKAFEALSELKGAGFEGRVGVRAAHVVSRDEQGRLTVPESVDAVGGTATLGGGLIGALLGVLGGPIGMLFGWTGGMLVGGAVDLNRVDTSAGLLDQMSTVIPPGGTAVVAEVDESDREVIDAEMGRLGGTVFRRSVDEVLDDLAIVEAAYEQAQRDARRAAREERKAERKADFHERRTALEKKLSID